MATDLLTLTGESKLTLRPGADLAAELDADSLDTLDGRGLLPLVAWLVRREKRFAELPAEHRERLRDALDAGRAGALRWRAAIELVVKALRSRGITPVLLKGADLGFHCYPEPGLRTMTDLDLLVPSNRLEAAASGLRAHGFSERTHRYSRQWYLDCRRCLPPTVHEELGIHLDVHATLLQPYSPFCLTTARRTAGVRPSLFSGTLRLAPEVLLWHLAVHCFVIHLGASDARERTRADLLAVLATEGEDLDRQELAAIGRGTRTGWALRRALALVEDVPAGADLRAAIEPTDPGREWGWRFVHGIRHALPFVGSDRPAPPDAWVQVGRRARRLVRSLAER